VAKLLVLVALFGQTQRDETQAQYIVIEDAQLQLISDVRVPARETGVLETLDVEEGDLVKRGQLLGTIDRRLALVELELAELDHQIAKLQSENDVDARYAEKSLEVAQSELKRSQEANQLYDDSVSQTEIERLLLTVQRSSLSLEQALKDQRVAVITETVRGRTAHLSSLRLENRQIVAPMDGMVVEIFGQASEWMDPGETVLRVIKLDQLRVEAHVDGRRFGRELEGCQVKLATALPPKAEMQEFFGKVVFVSPELQPVTGQVRIWAEVENRDLLLRPGALGTLTIELPMPKPSAGDTKPSQP
jgi:macrolide-specific efflux system membrane fusion protein